MLEENGPMHISIAFSGKNGKNQKYSQEPQNDSNSSARSIWVLIRPVRLSTNLDGWSMVLLSPKNTVSRMVLFAKIG